MKGVSKMQITITRRIAVTIVAVLALVGAGGAFAASGHSAGAAAKSGDCAARPGPGARADFATAVASYLGVTKAELKTARDDGTSLAQLAAQNGKTVAGLRPRSTPTRRRTSTRTSPPAS